LITDHAAREILQLADRCYVIDKGTVLCSGSPSEVKQHPDVRRRYLGDIDAGMPGPPAPHIASAREGREELIREAKKPFANW
jgi:lipopolysaccharide export system ATP-binding protein